MDLLHELSGLVLTLSLSCLDVLDQQVQHRLINLVPRGHVQQALALVGTLQERLQPGRWSSRLGRHLIQCLDGGAQEGLQSLQLVQLVLVWVRRKLLIADLALQVVEELGSQQRTRAGHLEVHFVTLRAEQVLDDLCVGGGLHPGLPLFGQFQASLLASLVHLLLQLLILLHLLRQLTAGDVAPFGGRQKAFRIPTDGHHLQAAPPVHLRCMRSH
mmetsp:Transcript_9557/g.28761  ORF Transcript_9557/g.28761 Transcript_9557/m.28761 type:complete len:215 (+) Transcript_9557:4902-5546(+)